MSRSGPGVVTDIAERLFEPFFTTEHDALGLGLSISRSIRSRAWAATESPRGATFHVQLPLPLGAGAAPA